MFTTQHILNKLPKALFQKSAEIWDNSLILSCHFETVYVKESR